MVSRWLVVRRRDELNLVNRPKIHAGDFRVCDFAMAKTTINVV